MTKYLKNDLQTIHNMLKEKKIKPIDLVLEAFEKIEQSDLNAFITLRKEEALKEAKELETMEVDNLFFGLPIAIKDNIVTKDLRTTCASHMLENFIPVYDATVVEKLKNKHMILLGKLNMDEFAMGSTGETSYFGSTKNPWNKTLVPGGSSSGSASAVSGGLIPFALGSDTGGSIRQPSNFCGVVGLKPTYGRVSRYGLIAFASSLDQIGPITRTVYENAALLNIISGQDEKDLTSSETKEDFTQFIGKDIKNLKIGIPKFYMSDVVTKEIKEQVLKIASLLKEQGVQVEEVDISYLEYAVPLYQIIALGEASSNLARFDGVKYGFSMEHPNNLEELYRKSRREGFGEEVRRRIMIGSYVLSGKNADIYYKKALQIRRKMAESFTNVFQTYDLLIGPVSTSFPCKIGERGDDAIKSFVDDLLTIPVNLAGLPAMSLPIAISKKVLPIGMHIIANRFDESKIYQLASYLEKHLALNLEPKEEDHE